ncbi:LytR C-terminal domain-containing protein [Rothia kristinae]|uniref:LytR C-terminal domain-containing protein n=1 Tax=Rothia kristinae TaxID=37923 RepID=UPI002E2B2ECA|nr:LytR C-terminal domain-containing protein [Rothia kristinae]MED6046507.1 LytR C-terminal domain-containing protein [Rothia kristinae]
MSRIASPRGAQPRPDQREDSMAETEDYAPDEFDEVPADSAHRGVYRAAAPAKAVSRRTTGAVILAGALALVLGALMFIYQPRSAAPEAQSESTQSEPVASASATASSGSSATEQAGASAQASADPSADPEITVGVYNSGQDAGAAGAAAQTLTAQGWTVSEVGNWSGPAVQEGTVYYRSGAEAQARRVAQDLGVTAVRASEEWSAQVTVVLTHG